MISGLYAITPDEADTDLLLAKVEAALQGGIRVLQYRNKQASYKLQTQQASAILPLCKQYQVPFIINDSVELCLILDADGVHIGADDGNISEVKARLGANKILGASCYNRFDLALSAQQASATYVAFGACFASSTKPHAPVASLDLFKQAKVMSDKKKGFFRNSTLRKIPSGKLYRCRIAIETKPGTIRAGLG